MIISMDALFDLPRKKAACYSYDAPLHGDIFFGVQEEVDNIVTSYSVPVPKEDTKVVCSLHEYTTISENFYFHWIVVIFWLGTL